MGAQGAHTYKWLNLLLEPRRHLQRLGFVYIEGERVRREKGAQKNFFNFFILPLAHARMM